SQSELWRNNAREALKGVPYLVEQRDDSGVYLSTVLTLEVLNGLYAGQDGRSIYFPTDYRTDSQFYDVANFVPANTVTVPASQYPAGTGNIPTRSNAGRLATQVVRMFDNFGTFRQEQDFGCISSASCMDYGQIQRIHTQQDFGGWLYRPLSENINGAR